MPALILTLLVAWETSIRFGEWKLDSSLITSDYEKVREEVRKAIDTHPNHPTLLIQITGLFLDYDFEEEEMDSEEFDDDDDDEEDEEESDSEQIEQESHHDDDNRPVARLTESSVDVAGTSPLVPALKKRKFACLNSGSSSSAAPATAGSNQRGASGQGMDMAAEDDNEAAQP